MSQNADILAHLRHGWNLTPMEALRRYQTFRLAARIGELRQMGHDIDTHKLKLPNGKRVAIYSLIKEST